MVTPEGCEERQDRYDHGQHDDELELDPEVVEVVRLYESPEPDEDNTLHDELSVGLTDDFYDLDVQRNLLHQSLFEEELQVIHKLSGIHIGVFSLPDGNLDAGVLGKQQDGQGGRQILDHDLTGP